MASIIKKKIKNQIYYYYVESKRINGKPKLVNQKYLGTAEKLLETVLADKTSLQERVLYSNASEFGAVALLYDLASRLDIIGLIDGVIHKRKQGASIGVYILTAAINRAVAPSSNNTCISSHDINDMEDAILRKMITSYDIDTSHIIYDATNFFTYIDTMQGCKTPKRGHSKEKRNDLRIVGLSLMVSPDFSIPLLHETYPGNRSDAKEFAVMMEKLKSRYEFLTNSKTDVTVVFDRGNNSESNINLLESGDFKLHYVGGLKKNQAAELFEVPHSQYIPLASPSLEGQSVYRTEMEVYTRTVATVIVYNPELEKGQMQGILINREKTSAKLMELQQKLMRRAAGEIIKGKKPTVESVTRSVETILKTEYMKDIFRYEILESGGNVYLTFATSDDALEQVREKQLGKTALFTDRHDFTNEEIVNAYRSAWHVEAAFKQMKNTEHLRVRPMFHWTDEKIGVHIFTCVLAYRLCCLLVKELSDRGINTNINRMLDEMADIKRINTFFGDIVKPEKVESYTLGSELAQQIESTYRLKQKYS